MTNSNLSSRHRAGAVAVRLLAVGMLGLGALGLGALVVGSRRRTA